MTHVAMTLGLSEEGSRLGCDSWFFGMPAGPVVCFSCEGEWFGSVFFFRTNLAYISFVVARLPTIVTNCMFSIFLSMYVLKIDE